MSSIFTLLLAAALGSAIIEVPDTPAGAALAEWLEAFNDGGRDRLRAGLGRFRFEESLDRTVEFRRLTGGFTLRKILESSPEHIRVLVEGREDDELAEGELEVESAPPFRINRWAVRVIPRTGEFARPTTTEAEALRTIRLRIDYLAVNGMFSGSVLIAHDGKAVYRDSHGMQDRERGIPNRVDTKFNLGSMNKMFTAVAMAQLEQRGKLSLSDTVGMHIADYPNAIVANEVTLRQLLAHTAGMGDIFGWEFAANRDNLKSPDDYIALFGTRAPQFEPGSSWSYSNYGFVVAGAVSERVSGMNYYDYVRKYIYAPAGMGDSDSYWRDQDVTNLAKGYTVRDGMTQENHESLPIRGSPAGGGYSTCEDLMRFAVAFSQHKLLDQLHTDQLISVDPVAPTGQGYGYGFQVWNEGGVRSYGHDGGAPGINSSLEVFPASGYVVVVLGNLDPPAAGRVARFIALHLPTR